MSDPALLQDSAELETFELIGSSKRIQLRGAIDASGSNDIETTIDAASTLTLTVFDADGKLRKALTGTWRMTALGMDWELSGKNKTGEYLSLTFEARLVADLRKQKGKAKAVRDKVTRAQFVRSRVIKQVRRAGGTFISPQLNVKQPIGKSTEKKSAKDNRRGQGFAKGTKIRGKEGLINLHNAEIAMDVATTEKASKRATLALLCACIVEGPDFRHSAVHTDHDSRGLLQVRDSTARPMKLDNMDREAVCRAFLRRGFWGKGGAIALAKKNPNQSVGWIAQQCQGSALPLRYDQYKKVAERIYDAYGGSGSSSTTRREAKRYAFTQGPPDGPKGENAWDMSGRLAEQVGWRRFVVASKDFYFVAERDLMKSRARAVLREHEGGVDWIDHDARVNTKVDKCTVKCRSKLWAAPPGSVVEIEGEGDANGRWLVSSIRRAVFGLDSTIELRRSNALVKALGEPAPETTTTTRSSGSGEGSGRGSSGQMVRPVSGGAVPAGGIFGAPRERGRKHAGLDIAVPVGTSVKAALGGTVATVGNDPAGYGIYIDVRHSGGLMTRYAHLSKTLVSSGKRVDRGQAIARSGNTGSSSGPHLHFEVHKGGVPQNPKSYI